MYAGCIHRISVTHTKKFSDFDETYSVCRAFNSENIRKNSSPIACTLAEIQPERQKLQNRKSEKMHFFFAFSRISFLSYLHQNKTKHSSRNDFPHPRDHAHRIQLMRMNSSWKIRSLSRVHHQQPRENGTSSCEPDFFRKPYCSM